MSSSKFLTIAVTGHVDHGKTTLVQRITGVNTDTLAEERSRGLSINSGFAYLHFQIPDSSVSGTLGFIDLPGHIDFMKNMLAAISGAQAALMVIAADDGIMPQTREHLTVLDLLDINIGCIVINKCDTVAQTRLDALRGDIHELVAPTRLRGAPVFAVSGTTGEGVDSLVSHLKTWVSSSTSVSVVSNQNERDIRHPRYCVDRAFPAKGVGTIVTGFVSAGTVVRGCELVHSASGLPVRIKALRMDKDDVDCARQGERAALVTGLPAGTVSRGDWLMAPAMYAPVDSFVARLHFTGSCPRPRPSTELHCHIGAAHHLVKIRALSKNHPEWFKVIPKKPVSVCRGDRIIMRNAAGDTVTGGGAVIGAHLTRKLPVLEQQSLLLSALDTTVGEAPLPKLLETGEPGIILEHFLLDNNLTAKGVATLLRELQNTCLHRLLRLRDQGRRYTWLIREQFYQDSASALVNCLATAHKEAPDRLGLDEPALRQRSRIHIPSSHFSGIVRSLITEGTLLLTGTQLYLPDHQVTLSTDAEKLMNAIKPALLTAGKIAPRVRELAESSGYGLGELERLMTQLRRAGRLIQVAHNRYYLPETVLLLADAVTDLAGKRGTSEGFSVIQFRDATGIGRNLCVEILEYFDRTGLTLRRGNHRFLIASSELDYSEYNHAQAGIAQSVEQLIRN